MWQVERYTLFYIGIFEIFLIKEAGGVIEKNPAGGCRSISGLSTIWPGFRPVGLIIRCPVRRYRARRKEMTWFSILNNETGRII